MTIKTHKLSVKEKVIFSFGDIASCIFFQTFLLFLLYFYTDVFGISAAAAGTMFAVTRIWDTINDPIMGTIADRTTTRWGKFRPYLLWIAIPFGIIGILTFSTPDLAMKGKLVYAYITYSLMMMAYTAINIPYTAMLGVISSDSLERTSVSSYKFIGTNIGGIIIQGGTIPLVKLLGQGSEAQGYQLTMILYSIVAVILFILCFYGTRERVQPPKDQKTKVGQDLKDLGKNTPWITLGVVGLLTLSWVSIKMGSTLYYFKYYVNNKEIFSSFMVAGSAASILGIILTKWFTSRFGKKRFYFIIMMANAVLMGVFFIASPEQIKLMFSLNILSSFIAGPAMPIVWAMYADTADYSEWKNNRRATALVFSAALFAQKMGWTVGGALAGWLLAYFGYVANMEQTENTIMGIRLMMSLIPAGISLLSAFAIYFYKLDDQTIEQISKELEQRRLQAAEA